MKKIEELADDLSTKSARHESFKKIFNAFQENIGNLQVDTFPVKGILLNNYSDEKTTVSFIGRTYEIKFSSCMVNNSFKGKISVSRVISENDLNEITCVTFNGQSIVDVQPPEGEDPISLKGDNDCMILVLDWLSSDINI